MNPTSSFFGKCVTVLIGMGLSWATMTNPQIEQLARHFLGQTSSTSTAMLDEEQFEQPFVEPAFGPVDVQAPSPTMDETPAQLKPTPSQQNFATQAIQPVQRSSAVRSEAARLASPQTQPEAMSNEDRIKLASQTLRDLGATYLRLEKLTNPDGEHYRVRCDLAGETGRVKCCYEATRESAVAAMEDVLRAVRDGVASNPTKVALSN